MAKLKIENENPIENCCTNNCERARDQKKLITVLMIRQGIEAITSANGEFPCVIDPKHTCRLKVKLLLDS